VIPETMRFSFTGMLLGLTLTVGGCGSFAADPVGPADMALIQDAMRQVEKS